MNKVLENILSMFYTVISVLGDFEAVWTALAKFAEYKDKLVAKVAEIELMKQATDKDITGWATTKGKKMKAVTKLAMGIAGSLKAFAIDTVNDVLKAEINFVKSDFYLARDTDFITMCNLVYKNANANIAALLGFGVGFQSATFKPAHPIRRILEKLGKNNPRWPGAHNGDIAINRRLFKVFAVGIYMHARQFTRLSSLIP